MDVGGAFEPQRRRVAEELGARWDGEELVVDDFEAFLDAYQMYEDGEYLIDND